MHVCLAGAGVSTDWHLVRSLGRYCPVTVVARLELLEDGAPFASADAIVIDCSCAATEWLDALQRVRDSAPHARVVLLNGGITQDDVATALQHGASDYFPQPYDRQLLFERLTALARDAQDSKQERLNNGME
ncbi:MAG: hypothetical protein ACRD26_21820 [Vicinamibacterales bacterium]